MDIEDFASALFKEWRVGTSTGTSLEESMGILLLFSRLDQKARIELGPGWFLSKDSESLRIMQEYLVPAFKRERYSSGLAFGASRWTAWSVTRNAPSAAHLGDDGGHRCRRRGALWTLISLLRMGLQARPGRSGVPSSASSGRSSRSCSPSCCRGAGTTTTWGSSSHSSGSSWGGGGEFVGWLVGWPRGGATGSW